MKSKLIFSYSDRNHVTGAIVQIKTPLSHTPSNWLTPLWRGGEREGQRRVGKTKLVFANNH